MKPSVDLPPVPTAATRATIEARPTFALCALAGGLAVVVGSTALAGWAFDIPILKSIQPEWVAMKPNTALAFILTGIAVVISCLSPLILHSDRTQANPLLTAVCFHLPRFSAWLAGLIGLFSLCEYAFGWNPGFDQWLFAEPVGAVGTSHLGRMAPDTAVCFVLLAVGREFLRRPRRTFGAFLAAVLSGSTIATMALAEILSYFTPNLRTHGWGGLTMMALPTAVVFLALGVALIRIAAQGQLPAPNLTAQPIEAFERSVGLRLLMVFAVLASCIIALGTFYYRDYERHFGLELERQLSAIADLKVSELAAWRAERQGDGALLFQNPSFSGLVRQALEQPADENARRHLLDWLGRIKAAYGYDQVRLMDAQGVTRLSLPAELPPASDAARQTILEDMKSGQIGIQDFFLNERDHRIYLQVTVPILEGSNVGPPLGVVKLRIDPTRYLYPFIQHWPVPSQSAETLLVRQDGNSVLFLNALRFQPDAALQLKMPLDRRDVPSIQVVLGQTGITKGLDYRGVQVLAALRKVPDSPWFLVAKMDFDEAHAPLRNQLWEVTTMVGLFLVGGASIATLVWRHARLRFYQAKAQSDADLARLGAIVESSDDAIISKNLDGIIQSWNRGAERCYGYSAAEMIGQPISVLDPPERTDESQVHLENIRRGKLVELYETERMRKDGQRVQVSLKLSPIRDRNGELVGYSAIGRDITQQKRAESALRETERLLAEAQVMAKLGGYVLDFSSGRWTSSAALDDVFGIDQSFDRTVAIWQNLVHPDDRTTMADYLSQEVIGQKQTFNKEYRIIRHRDGAERWVHGLGKLQFSADGRLETMRGSIQDITERRQADLALRESEAKFKGIFERSNVGKSLTLISGEVQVNRAFATMLGYSPEELRRRTWQSITPPEDVEPTQRAVAPLLTGKQDSTRLTKRYLHKNGSVIWADVSTTLQRDEAGRPLYFITAAIDITAARLAEAKLATQLTELRRWHEATIDREGRVLVVKREVNELLARLGEPPRYSSAEAAQEPGPAGQTQVGRAPLPS